MEWKKKGWFFAGVLFTMLILYNLTMFFSIDRPIINDIKQNYIVQNTIVGDSIRLNMYGQNFDNIICVYLNDVWEKECGIEYVSAEEIALTFPQRYCENAGDLTIQLEKKINSDKTVFSNKGIVRIIEDTSSVQPVITGTDIQVLDLNSTENRILKIYGNNFEPNCKVTINNKQYDINYIDSSNVEVTLLYSDWCQEQALSIQVSQQSTEGDIVYNLSSANWIVNVTGEREHALTYDWIKYRHIAHALGIYNEKAYTNSLEAFQESYAKGFKVFEADMTFASDNVLMLRHNWGKESLKDTNFAESRLNNLPKSFDETKSAVTEYTVLSFDDLCDIMMEYPDIYIVTDTKDINSGAIDGMFRYIVEHARAHDESILDRIIVQIYNEAMYYQVMNIYNFRSIIYTLYQTADSDEKILNFVQNTGIKVVTMFEERLSDPFKKQLDDLGIYVYVHTINEIDAANRLWKNGVYGIYTDSLMPSSYTEIQNVQETVELKQINSIEGYMEEIRKHANFVMILSVRDDASVGMQPNVQEFLYENGAEETLLNSSRESYIYICADGKAIYEENNSEKTIEYRGLLGDSSLMVLSGGYECGDVSQIIIDGIDYSPNQRGFNIVVFDMETQSVYDVVNCDFFTGGTFSRYDIVEIVKNQMIKKNLDFMLEYFENLANENYLVLFSVSDDIGSYFTEEVKEKWNMLGLEKAIGYRESYIGILNGRQLLYEESSSGRLVYDDFVDGIHLHVESAGFESGCFSSVMINGQEYSKNTRGLNIVVFDKRRNVVIDSIAFDFYNGYSRNY